MSVVLIAALMTALFSGWLVHPLMRDNRTRRRGIVLLSAIALSALALYLLLGSPLY